MLVRKGIASKIFYFNFETNSVRPACMQANSPDLESYPHLSAGSDLLISEILCCLFLACMLGYFLIYTCCDEYMCAFSTYTCMLLLFSTLAYDVYHDHLYLIMRLLYLSICSLVLDLHESMYLLTHSTVSYLFISVFGCIEIKNLCCMILSISRSMQFASKCGLGPPLCEHS